MAWSWGKGEKVVIYSLPYKWHTFSSCTSATKISWTLATFEFHMVCGLALFSLPPLHVKLLFAFFRCWFLFVYFYSVDSAFNNKNILRMNSDVNCSFILLPKNFIQSWFLFPCKLPQLIGHQVLGLLPLSYLPDEQWLSLPTVPTGSLASQNVSVPLTPAFSNAQYEHSYVL